MNPFENLALIREEFKNSSDRASVIVAGTLIDQILEEIIVIFLIVDVKSDKEIFNGLGPLSSFSGKIKMCYRLGLISNREYEQLEIFRFIRNKFAHKIKDCTLESPDLQDKIKKLVISRNLLPPEDIPIPKYPGQEVPLLVIEEVNTSSPRDIFEKFIFYIVNSLMGRYVKASDKKVIAPKEFNYSYEPLIAFVENMEFKASIIDRSNFVPGQSFESAEAASALTPKNKLLIKTAKFIIEQIKKALKNL